MEGINTQGINICNRLIQTCQDSVDGFREAAGAVESAALKQLFERITEEREWMVTDLQGEIVSLGSEANDGGSLLAAMHRGWINLKSVISGHDENEILAECLRGEDVALEQFQDALGGEMPPLTRELITNLFTKVVDARRSLVALQLATR